MGIIEWLSGKAEPKQEVKKPELEVKKPMPRGRRRAETRIYNISQPKQRRYLVYPDTPGAKEAYEFLTKSNEYVQADERFGHYKGAVEVEAESQLVSPLEFILDNPERVAEVVSGKAEQLREELEPEEAVEGLKFLFRVDTFLGKKYFNQQLLELKDQEAGAAKRVAALEQTLKIKEEMGNQEGIDQVQESIAKAVEEHANAQPGLDFAVRNCFFEAFQRAFYKKDYDVKAQSEFVRRAKNKLDGFTEHLEARSLVYENLAKTCTRKRLYTTAAGFYGLAARDTFKGTIRLEGNKMTAAMILATDLLGRKHAGTEVDSNRINQALKLVGINAQEIAEEYPGVGPLVYVAAGLRLLYSKSNYDEKTEKKLLDTFYRFTFQEPLSS